MPELAAGLRATARQMAARTAMAVLTIAGVALADAVLSPAPAEARCTISTTLRLGSTGAAVRCLQSRLNALGYDAGPVDGWFGPMTRAAVVRYQRAQGLEVDGIVGRQTARSLRIWARPCQAPAGVPARARRLVVVTASGTLADVDLLVRGSGVWRCKRADMYGRVGRNGVRPLRQRRSGDGTTPAGIFRLGTMRAPDGQSFQFFGNGANPGVQGSWRQVRAGDCWGATPSTARYNQLVQRSASRCNSPDEYLPSITGAYSQAAIIGANLGPRRSGDEPGEIPYAAAIFLHRHSYTDGVSRPTSGCVSLNAHDLAAFLPRLVPGRTWFVIRSA
jgi:peptidoglycan hydrolase-like protein with peptidoglycan-binding domain